jgi:hypothetical protein
LVREELAEIVDAEGSIVDLEHLPESLNANLPQAPKSGQIVSRLADSRAGRPCKFYRGVFDTPDSIARLSNIET